ncbi:hypothetical protein VB715_14495 [Crocosphaera sp. UHCC 0190]|uniref:hypothetical protein n=1 Tax=Crocosphaera sp. UHCC 0190 TaxID=3110246 RepID=UPI002B214963|nr:hypothetical protein [Crocosphaera sp. UHCC 0190]MEA5510980.1 hypothetical protein [Crocosphaera sp. UHCC 0190]
MIDSENNPDLDQREKILFEKEQELRLRELEMEIFRESQAQEPPLYQTQKNEPTAKKGKAWPRKIILIAKCFVLMVTVFVAIRIASWLALGIMIGAISWASYKLFIEGDNSAK